MKLDKHFHKTIRNWYELHGRKNLPWRCTSDAYAIYISEVMLQQTQVKTVLARYYFPFLEKFPTLQALASAPLQDVLKAWEGLGYYSRARNLHRAAQLYGITLPQSVDELIALPGIGRNTAHAIAAFAYHQNVAVMEANVKRVLHRLFALPTMSDALLWQRAGELVDPENPYIYNQAMMDIGASICTITSPACAICPLNAQCLGKHNPLAYPVKRVKKTVPVKHKRIVVFENNGRFMVLPRSGRLLGGLYGFAQFDAREVVTLSGDVIDNLLTLLGEIEQVYSHFRLNASVYHVHYAKEVSDLSNWYELQEIVKLPLSKVDLKVLELLKTTYESA